MSFLATFSLLLIVGWGAWSFMSRRLEQLTADSSALSSRPTYFKVWALLWGVLPVGLVVLLGLAFESTILHVTLVDHLPERMRGATSEELRLVFASIDSAIDGSVVQSYLSAELRPAAERLIELKSMYANIVYLTAVFLAITLVTVAVLRARIDLPVRQFVERWNHVFLVISATVAIITTIGIVLTLLFEALRFFQLVSPLEFLFGTHWSPQISLGTNDEAAQGSFGAVPLFAGTLLIAVIALLVALPIGLYTAIYLSEFASSTTRSAVKPVLEVLAGIPTVVYGFFAALTVAPAIRAASEWLSALLIDLGVIDSPIDVSSESALAAGLVIGVMLIPFISSMADDVFRAVPRSLRDGSLGLGATKRETVSKVIFPAALPGVVGGVMLAISRAIGETMIVVMAAGLAAKLTANPFDSVTTVTVQIVTLLVGDQEFDSAKTLSAYALGLVLFVATLLLNVIALHIVDRYREQYD